MEQNKFVELVKSDDEALILLKKLNSPHTPLTIEDLPYRDSGTVNTNLHRLFELHKEGWINIKEISNSDDCVLKEFSISDKGKEHLNSF
jgi:hypothetical protein